MKRFVANEFVVLHDIKMRDNLRPEILGELSPVMFWNLANRNQDVLAELRKLTGDRSLSDFTQTPSNLHVDGLFALRRSGRSVGR